MRPLLALWAVSGIVAPLTPHGALWGVWAVTSGVMLWSVRWTINGAGRRPMPMWEFWHWIAADAIDAEDIERQRKMKR